MAEAGAGSSLMREVLPAIVLGVLGTVLLIVGSVAGSITAGIGFYILSTFNKSGITIPGGTGGYNYLEAITGLIPIIFTLIGIALLVAAAVIAIVVLLRSVGAMRTETGLGV